MTQPARRQPFALSVLLSAMLLSGQALAAVSDQDILQDPKNPEQVVTNGLGVQGQRYSPLDILNVDNVKDCLLYTSPSPRDRTRSRMPSSA